MDTKLVTVVCLCHNQAPYVQQALESIKNQTYPYIQVIIIDDGSTDGSKHVIKEFITQFPDTHFISNEYAEGNCSAFNKALPYIKGSYVIDLAADDILLPNRIATGLIDFNKANDRVGVHFSDAELIDNEGNHLSYHSSRFPHSVVPKKNIYVAIIERYFICSPSMMFKKEVLDFLNGYDENLHYEDFDFWIRSSRHFDYCYSSQVLVKKRILRDSLMTKQFSFGSKMQRSTFKVCTKILMLNTTSREQKALSKRIIYEISTNLRQLNWLLCFRYALLFFRNLRMSYTK